MSMGLADQKKDRDGAGGLECPVCGCPESEVIETRRRFLRINGKLVGAVVRRRKCDHCDFRFSTNERIREDE